MFYLRRWSRCGWCGQYISSTNNTTAIKFNGCYKSHHGVSKWLIHDVCANLCQKYCKYFWCTTVFSFWFTIFPMYNASLPGRPAMRFFVEEKTFHLDPCRVVIGATWALVTNTIWRVGGDVLPKTLKSRRYSYSSIISVLATCTIITRIVNINPIVII